MDSTETVGGLITLGLTESMCKQDCVAHSWAVDEVENNSFQQIILGKQVTELTREEKHPESLKHVSYDILFTFTFKHYFSK